MGRANHTLYSKRAGEATRQDERVRGYGPYEAGAKKPPGIRLGQAMSLSLLPSIHCTKPAPLACFRVEPNAAAVCSLAHLRYERSDGIPPDVRYLTTRALAYRPREAILLHLGLSNVWFTGDGKWICSLF
jgi:hypothetical protein